MLGVSLTNVCCSKPGGEPGMCVMFTPITGSLKIQFVCYQSIDTTCQKYFRKRILQLYLLYFCQLLSLKCFVKHLFSCINGCYLHCFQSLVFTFAGHVSGRLRACFFETKYKELFTGPIPAHELHKSQELNMLPVASPRTLYT